MSRAQRLQAEMEASTANGSFDIAGLMATPERDEDFETVVLRRLNIQPKDHQRISKGSWNRQTLRRQFLTLRLDFASMSICSACVQQQEKAPPKDSCQGLQVFSQPLFTKLSATLSVLNAPVRFGIWRKRRGSRHVSNGSARNLEWILFGKNGVVNT